MDDEQRPWWTRPPEPASAEPEPEPAPDATPLAHPGLHLGQAGPMPGPMPDPIADPAPDPDLGSAPAPDPADAVTDPRLAAVPEPVTELQAPAEPPIRRVGVVPDPPRPPRPRYTVAPGLDLGPAEPRDSRRDLRDEPPPGREARTETLPAIPDDIFATFSSAAPDGIITGPIPTQLAGQDPLAHLRQDPEAARPPRRPVDPRTLMIGGAGLLVLLIIALLAMFSSGGRGATASRNPDPGSSGTSDAAASAAAADFGGTAPEGLSKVASTKAAQLLQAAGQKGNGAIVEAWTWKDENGSNLVVSTRKALPGRHFALKVIHLGHVETDSPKTLRIMNEPGLPDDCKAGGSAGFTKNSLLIRDLDGDGYAEIAAGWSSACGQAKASEVKLALISNGQKFIIRGNGVIGGAPGSFDPDPKDDNWPSGYLPALQTLFHQLYY